MTDVIKRNGQKEQFREEKIRSSIESAVKDAGFNVGQKREVIEHAAKDAINMAQGMEQVKVRQIRDTVLKDLEQDDREVAQAWKNYEKEHGMKY